jgi:spermidine synthase
MRSRQLYAGIFACFFVSGFCSLLYQVVWTRLAFAHFGIITPVLSLIVSVFMLGIGIGSIAAGRICSRLNGSGASSLYAYAATETFIGCGALAVPAIFLIGQRLLLRTGGGSSGTYLLLSAILITLAVLPWSTAMGATIPLMLNVVKRTALPQRENTFSMLYLANVLGGALGALAVAFVFIEAFGIRGTYELAAGLNFAIALLAVGIAGALRRPLRIAADRAETVNRTATPTPLPLTGLILFATGFCSLGMEVVWARDFTFSLHTTIYAFAAVLATYLLATAAGSQYYRRSGVREIDLGTALAWVCIAGLLPLIFTDPRLGPSAARTLLSIVPICAVLGFLTPFLVDRAAAGDPWIAGRYYAINVFGCIIGPLAAAYILLPVVGIRWSLIAFSIPLALIALAAGRHWTRYGMATLALCAALFIACGAAVRAYDDGSIYAARAQVRRDFAASVVATGSGMGKRLFVNSVPITSLTTITKIMAHFPMAVHYKSRTVLDICFGMGTTFRSLTTWNVDTTAVDLSSAVIGSFGYFHSDSADVLKRPHARVIVDDGRRYLMRSGMRYDLITIDPPPPIEAAGSSLLYSNDFYSLVKAHLAPGGILAQWAPALRGATLQSIALALHDSFRYVRAFRDRFGTHFLASETPIDIPNARALAARMPAAARSDLVEWEPSKSAASILQRVLAGEEPMRGLLPAGGSRIPALSDDRPFNEYYFLRRGSL